MVPVPDIDFGAVFEAVPTPYLVLDPDLRIVAVNRAREQATGHARAEVLGRHLFEAYPDNPADPAADGVANLGASLRRVLDTARPDTMAVQQYDVPRAGGGFDRRWWTPVNAPVLDAEGRVVLLLHRVEDVTDLVEEHLRADPRATPDTAPTTPPAVGSALRSARVDLRAARVDLRTARGDLSTARVDLRQAEGDLYLRELELQAARDVEDGPQRLAALAGAALALAAVRTVDDLVGVVLDAGLSALGGTCGGLAVVDEGGELLDVTTTTAPGRRAPRTHRRLPASCPQPACVAARTGRPVLLRDRDAAPAAGQDPAGPGGRSGAALPLRVGARLLGSLVVGWDEPQAFATEDVELMTAFAAQCAQALDRLQVLAQRRAVAETLQQAMLTALPQPDHLQLHARYVPAADTEQVGGDWYDAVVMPDGATTLVIGDVVGHDVRATATMGQLRSMTRTLAWSLGRSGAHVLASVDAAVSGLRMDALATCLLGRIEQSPAQAAVGMRRLRWSSAGHPPPLLVPAEGPAHYLAGDSDLPLGVSPEHERHDHVGDLPVGSTLLLFTDGLVERRDRSLTVGLEVLRRTAQRHVGLELTAMVAALVDDLVRSDALGGDPRHDDDVAVLAVRMHPEDRPRPPEAGPGHL